MGEEGKAGGEALIHHGEVGSGFVKAPSIGELRGGEGDLRDEFPENVTVNGAEVKGAGGEALKMVVGWDCEPAKAPVAKSVRIVVVDV